MVDHLVTSVRRAVDEQNWYAALSLALTLPDICGRLEDPEQKSKPRYVAWCSRYVTPRYTVFIGADREKSTFLSGEDFYALRCAVLHEGRDDIVDKHARVALEKFAIREPPGNGILIHNNLMDNKVLQLQVDMFCLDVCNGVDQWTRERGTDPVVQSGIAALMRIEPFNGSLG